MRTSAKHHGKNGGRGPKSFPHNSKKTTEAVGTMPHIVCCPMTRLGITDPSDLDASDGAYEAMTGQKRIYGSHSGHPRQSARLTLIRGSHDEEFRAGRSSHNFQLSWRVRSTAERGSIGAYSSSQRPAHTIREDGHGLVISIHRMNALITCDAVISQLNI